MDTKEQTAHRPLLSLFCSRCTAGSGTERLCARGSPMALLILALRRGFTGGGAMPRGFWAGAPATQAAPATNPPFTLHTKQIPPLETFPQRPAVPSALLSPPGHPARPSRRSPFPHHSPSPCHHTPSPPKPSQCLLISLSTGRYSSGLHPSSQTKILNILKYNQQVAGYR